jgi:DNA invertase Pin-like site-specific DNA recombinase
MQVDALIAKGIPTDRIYSDVESGRLSALKREGLSLALKALRRGDTLWVWRLDRLGRNVIELLLTVHRLHERGIKFGSLTQSELNSDAMQTASGTFMFHIHAALCQYESDQISERTKAGMEAARARGAKFGRQTFEELYILSGRVEEFQRLVKGGMPSKTACKELNIPDPTFRKYRNVFEPVVPAVDDLGPPEEAGTPLLVDDIGHN